MSDLCVGKEFSSSTKFQMDKEFIYYNYDFIRRENSPVYGVTDSSEVVITPVYYDELNYILNSDGMHVFLFGGTWSGKTQAIIDRVNFFARKYGVDTVYNFDFSADGEGEYSSIKADLTEQENYDGPGKREAKGCAMCNYEYGEIVTRNLTNLNDWVRAKIGTPDDITYLNLYCDAVTVPRLTEPFIFLYDRNHEGGPIIYAIESDYTRDELPADFDEQFEKLFSLIAENGGQIASYTHQDYMFDAFKQNERGHAFKTEDAFKKDEQINITPVTFQTMRWILSQKGSFLVLFAGAWCANSQACIATINDYAVANDVQVYMIDSRIDGKYPIDFWYYPRQNELRLSMPATRKCYIDLWERCLPAAPILTKIDPGLPGRSFNPYVEDEEGNQHAILGVDIPYILAVNSEHKSARGDFRPVLAALNHDGYELINCNKTFIYHWPNYRKYTAGMYYIMNAYCDSLGLEVKDIEIDRTAPIVPGKPVENPNKKGEVKYFKEHNWYEERSGRSEDSCDIGCC